MGQALGRVGVSGGAADADRYQHPHGRRVRRMLEALSMSRSALAVACVIVASALPAHGRIHAIIGGRRFVAATGRHATEHQSYWFDIAVQSRHGVRGGSRAYFELACSGIAPGDALPKVLDCRSTSFTVTDAKDSETIQTQWGGFGTTGVQATVTFLRVTRTNRWHIRGTFAGSLDPGINASSPLEIVNGHFSVNAYDSSDPGA